MLIFSNLESSQLVNNIIFVCNTYQQKSLNGKQFNQEQDSYILFGLKN